jgi:F0F1-type ATP synthase assembly protein I
MQEKQPNQKKNNYSGLDQYAKYSGIAFQMVAIILVFVWAGKKIDEKYFQGKDIFVIILSLLGVGISLYLVLKDLKNISRNK